MKSFFVRFLNAVTKALTGFEPCCRFEPSCSHYFMEALEKRGWIKGSWLGMKRLLRCTPNQKFGYDPVP